MKVLVVFYSMTGNVYRLAEAVALGARQAGAEVRLKQVPELIPPEVVEQNPKLREGRADFRSVEIATNEDLRWADGVCFGSPTRYGNMAAQLKNFLDQTGDLWLKGELVGKVAGCFTSSSTQHGGQESTLLSMMVPLFHLGFVVQGLPYSETAQMGMDQIHGGSPYGASSISGPDGKKGPTKEDLELATALGRLVATTAGRLRASGGGRERLAG